MHPRASSYVTLTSTEASALVRERQRAAAAREERSDAMLGKMSDETLGVIALYRAERERAKRQGKPVLSTLEEMRRLTLPEETPTK